MANWSGQWPGLVGLLNLNASLRKAGKSFDTLWSVDFTDRFFLDGLKTWLKGEPDPPRPLACACRWRKRPCRRMRRSWARTLADRLRRDKAILGVFDEGCMGMYNAIIPDELLAPMGVFKERLSQSALYAEMLKTSDAEARAVYDWLLKKGMKFKFGPSAGDRSHRGAGAGTMQDVHRRRLRIADAFGCDAVGIQYQQGLKDLTAGLRSGGRAAQQCRSPAGEGPRGQAALCRTRRCRISTKWMKAWRSMPWSPTGCGTRWVCRRRPRLHDVRYGEDYDGRFVWTLEISGSVPPAHFARGYAEAVSERQPPMYFRLGGGTIKGISKPGQWCGAGSMSRPASLKADMGLAQSVALPQEETERRWQITTPQWPMMHTVFPGISRDQFMAQHCSNHIQVAYAPDEASAAKALAVKAAMFSEMGIAVNFCGDVAA